jgi:hypothetical protein
MNLYIKVENGVPTGYPMIADNLKGILETSTLTDAIALAAGYYPFQNTNIPDNVVVTGDMGFELCADGIVRKNITVRELTSAEKVDLWIKPARDSLLYKCDWTQATDSPLSTADKAAWAKYRQALRDLPSKYPNLDKGSDIVWPTPPGELTTVKPITP